MEKVMSFDVYKQLPNSIATATTDSSQTFRARTAVDIAALSATDPSALLNNQSVTPVSSIIPIPLRIVLGPSGA